MVPPLLRLQPLTTMRKAHPLLLPTKRATRLHRRLRAMRRQRQTKEAKTTGRTMVPSVAISARTVTVTINVRNNRSNSLLLRTVSRLQPVTKRVGQVTAKAGTMVSLPTRMVTRTATAITAAEEITNGDRMVATAVAMREKTTNRLTM